jgi:magnesium transporter
MSVVNCVAYASGSRIREVVLDDVSEFLEQPDEGFVWIGLYDPDERELRKVQEEFGLHDLAIEDAHRAHQRPKIEDYGESLFVVLRTAQADREKHEVAFGETHVFVGPRYVVSVRHGASLSYSEVRARCEASPAYLRQGPGFVLYAIMDFVVDHYFPIVDELEEELSGLEEEIFSGAPSGKRIAQRIYELKAQMLHLKRAVSPLVEVCNRLARYDSNLILAETRLYFRDVYDHVIRINESVDNMRELLTSALETNLALVSVRQNEVMKRLAAGAAMITVPTLIAGIYGMNFEGMPELHWALGYPLAIGMMVASCAYLYYRFRKAHWL